MCCFMLLNCSIPQDRKWVVSILCPRVPNSAWHKGVLCFGAEILLVEAKRYKVTLVHVVGKLGCGHMVISLALVT